MKILAVGMNYVAHCQELHANENLPKEPVIFMKPDSALLKDSKPFLSRISLGRWIMKQNWWFVSTVWEKHSRTICASLL